MGSSAPCRPAAGRRSYSRDRYFQADVPSDEQLIAEGIEQGAVSRARRIRRTNPARWAAAVDGSTPGRAPSRSSARRASSCASRRRASRSRTPRHPDGRRSHQLPRLTAARWSGRLPSGSRTEGAMGYIDVNAVSYTLADGRPLLDEVSFRVGEGTTSALIGANGAGKSTLLRLIRGDLRPDSGAISIEGGLGVMDQLIGHVRDRSTVRDLLVSVSPRGDPRRGSRAGCRGARDHRARHDGVPARGTRPRWRTTPMRVATTRRRSGTPAPLRPSASRSNARSTASSTRCRAVSRSGSCSKPCCAVESRCSSSTSRTTTSTYPANAGSRMRCARLRRRCCWSVTTVSCSPAPPTGSSPWSWVGQATPPGRTAAASSPTTRPEPTGWTVSTSSGGAGTSSTRSSRTLVATLKVKATANDGFASRYRAAQTRLRMFEEEGPPQERPPEQDLRMRLGGGRTGNRAVVCEQLELTGLMAPFDLEVWFGDRVAVLGSNGSGKSHFLRLLAAGGSDPEGGHRTSVGGAAGTGRAHRSRATGRTGSAGLVRAIAPASRADRPHAARDPAPWRRRAGGPSPRTGQIVRSTATASHPPPEQTFESLSGGQQARFQILLLELTRRDAPAARRADRQPRPRLG